MPHPGFGMACLRPAVCLQAGLLQTIGLGPVHFTGVGREQGPQAKDLVDRIQMVPGIVITQYLAPMTGALPHQAIIAHRPEKQAGQHHAAIRRVQWMGQHRAPPNE